MQVLTPGHKYVAANFENPENGQTIQFIEKSTDPSGIGVGDDGVTLYTMNDGTTNEELIEIIVDRLTFLNAKFPCRENSVAITHLETALLWLNKRTADRKKRGVEGKHAK